MKNSTGRFKGTKLFVVAFVALVALGSLSMLTRARSVMSNITVVNNSSRDVKHLYLSPPNSNNWGPDQLNSAITPNNSFTVSCNQSSIKVVAEDQDGCFMYQVVDCSGDVSWTITNQATRDCGN